MMTPEEIKELRRSLRLDQPSFASAVGLTGRPEYISRLENGREPLVGPLAVLLELIRDCRQVRDFLRVTKSETE